MGIGLIIIGDEILSGRRTDKHLANLINLLQPRGLVLNWVKILSDDKTLLLNTFKESFNSDDYVFSTGGIGSTPDDLTRGVAAEALGVPLQPHPIGLQLLEEFAHDKDRELMPHHYQMVDFPQGSEVIPNAVNKIPGFSINNHFFTPGFPAMAESMMEWVLNNKLNHLVDADYDEKNILVIGAIESALTPLMEELVDKYPELKLFSLPMLVDGIRKIELGLKGNCDKVSLAMDELTKRVAEMGYTYE
jgi:molybdopterin-biosynthesis enzyme MoeA-like protein